MREHPILFSGPMVRAILDGKKTQTRRVITRHNSEVDGRGSMPYRCAWEDFDFDKAWVDHGPSPAGNPGPYLKVPLPKMKTVHRVYSRTWTGDRLYVREAAYIAPPNFAEDCDANWKDNEGRPRVVSWRASMEGDSIRCADEFGVKCTPSIHVPRWACRLVLEVESIRVERLQEINEGDAFAEGIECDTCGYTHDDHLRYGDHHICKRDVADQFAALWDSINGKRAPWESNPWVRATTFRRV